MSAVAASYIVGLTGGIGSGKSKVAEYFMQLGAGIVDTDEIAHFLTRPGGPAIDPIRTAFGSHMIAADGRLDRKAMRDIVFANDKEKERLESILHPLIRIESERLCAQATAPYVILAVPLLLESGHYRDRCDRICVVDCTEQTQIRRVQARSGLDEQLIWAIIASQIDRAARLRAADDVIDNDGPLEALFPQVEKLHRQYLEKASRHD